MTDFVNKPPHYTDQGPIECIDAIQSAMSAEQFEGWLRGNVLKYLWRYPSKNKIEDLEKALFYLDKLRSVKIEYESTHDFKQRGKK